MSEVHPFSSGTEYMDWRARNCERCSKDYDPAKDTDGVGQGLCDIETTLSLAAIGEGTISDDIAVRLKFDGVWIVPYCPEKEASDVE